MNRTKSLLVVFVVLTWSGMAPVGARAEWFAGLYLGVASTTSKDVTIVEPAETDILNDVDLDSSISFGGRVGHWFETALYRDLNWGLALDISHFRPDIDSQVVPGINIDAGGPDPDVFLLSSIDLAVTPISFDLMLRWPFLKSRQFPKGQLQPYFTIGPTLFIASAEDSINFDPFRQSDTDTSLGLKVGTGLAWYFVKNFAVFGEYRFTHFSPEFDFRDGGDPVTVETDVNTHHFITGVSYYF